MTNRKCDTCGNRHHWHHAFSKFGYDDGDGIVETPDVARVLEKAGYTVKYSRWSPHNTLIYSIQKDGVEYMPLHNPDIRIGYDDPAIYLQQDIQNLLNDKIPHDRLFY